MYDLSMNFYSLIALLSALYVVVCLSFNVAFSNSLVITSCWVLFVATPIFAILGMKDSANIEKPRSFSKRSEERRVGKECRL